MHCALVLFIHRWVDNTKHQIWNSTIFLKKKGLRKESLGILKWLQPPCHLYPLPLSSTAILLLQPGHMVDMLAGRASRSWGGILFNSLKQSIKTHQNPKFFGTAKKSISLEVAPRSRLWHWRLGWSRCDRGPRRQKKAEVFWEVYLRLICAIMLVILYFYW